MHGFPATHSVLHRSLDELDARNPSLIDIPLPVNSIPIAGPLADPLVGDGAEDSQHPPTSPGNPPGNPPSANPPPGNPPPGTISTISNGNSHGKGGGSNPTNSPMPKSGGGAAIQPVVSSKTTPISTPGNPPSSSSAKNANGGSSTVSPLSPEASGSHSVSNGQAASATAGTPSSSLAMSLGAQATNFLEVSQSSSGSGSSIVGSLAPPSTTAVATSAGERLSGGTIAGITIVCLFAFLALILLVFRRRSIARRVELRNQWWSNRTSGSGSFSSVGRPRSPMNTNGEASASRLSARSSFATNFDQGLMFRPNSPSRFSLGAVPEYPPMAEVHERNSALISTGAAVARRNSMNSMLTHGSNPDAQYLAVSTNQNNLEPFTPMSVRPFSPSESFFFPKPPMPLSTDSLFFPGTQGYTSDLSSATTLIQTLPPSFMIDPPTSAANSAALSPLTAAANTSPDPFADPVKPEFAELKVIRRPFAPSLDDELMVYPGDHVRVFQIFDDGWAFVEKSAGTEGKRHERGLIPLDCLRAADQPLPTFLAQKRISYGSDQPIGCAL